MFLIRTYLRYVPTMQEDYIEQVHAVDGGFNGQSQRKYDPFSNTYNPGWRDHPTYGM